MADGIARSGYSKNPEIFKVAGWYASGTVIEILGLAVSL
jgi:hypothetical protein